MLLNLSTYHRRLDRPPEVLLTTWLERGRLGGDPERDWSVMGNTDPWDEMLKNMPGATATDDPTYRKRQLHGWSSQAKLYRDRHAHLVTTLLMEKRRQDVSRARRRSLDASDLATRSKVNVTSYYCLGVRPGYDTELQERTARSQAALHSCCSVPQEKGTVYKALKLLKRLSDPDDRVALLKTAALAAHDANRSTNGDDSHVSGTWPTEVVDDLIQMFKKIEIVFILATLGGRTKIKFYTCTLHSQVHYHVELPMLRTVGHAVAYAIEL
ncbi:hypothetical protein Tco_0476348 [Tanacetum coccineum]